jgi:hypothetical protein
MSSPNKSLDIWGGLAQILVTRNYKKLLWNM